MFEGSVGVCAVVSVGLPVGGAGSVGSVVGQLAEAAGSPGAMALLAAVDPALLSSSGRVHLVRAWERQLSWVASCQLPVVAALELRDGDGLPEVLELPDAAREELAGALHVLATAAQSRLELARDLGGRLAATGEGLRAGRLTVDGAAGRGDRPGGAGTV